MSNIFTVKPEHWNYQDKAVARWYHSSLLGSVCFSRQATNRIIDSPTTTEYQKDLARQIKTLAEKLEAELRSERINC